MSVKVTSFVGAMLDYIHEDYPFGVIDEDNPENSTPQGHSGQMDSSTIVYTQNADGSPNEDFILVICPEHPTMGSVWPVGGGADARLGQMLHLKMALQSLPRVEAVAQLKARIAETDFPERYCLTDEDIAEVEGATSPNPTV